MPLNNKLATRTIRERANPVSPVARGLSSKQLEATIDVTRRRREMTRLASAIILVFAIGVATSAQDKKDGTKTDLKKDRLKLTEEEQAVIDFTNAERKKADLLPLMPNAQLMAAARSHAANMAKQDKLEHVLDEKNPSDRVKDTGYKYSTTGENIAWNARSPKEVVKGWMESPPHKENILRTEFTEIGVAVAKDKKGEPYWVQVFGTPKK
jgi:uncharacterized protein YkwD